jgi:ATPase family associated with various cellular activities (AAA)
MADTVPERFRRAVSLHIISNLRPAVDEGTPLILGIQGPPGEGKTYQVQRVLKDAEIHAVLLSGGELESPDAGMPAARVRAAYLEAGARIQAGDPAVVLLNDADAAIGNWGELTQYTVNTQNLVTELMHLCDYPTRVEGQGTRRAPIILTGNDFTRIYGPLRRAGRMRIFTWVMDPQERAQILLTMFPGLSERDARGLVSRFDDKPVAFWAVVRGQLDDRRLAASIFNHGLHGISRHLISGGDIKTEEGLPGFAQICEAAESVARDSAFNYLDGRSS